MPPSSLTKIVEHGGQNIQCTHMHISLCFDEKNVEFSLVAQLVEHRIGDGTIARVRFKGVTVLCP